MVNADKSIKVDGLEKSIIDKCKQRIIAIAVIFFVSFIVVNIKLIDTSKPFKAKEQTSINIQKSIKRGNILDRNGNILAISMPTWSLAKNRNIIFDIELTEKTILQILPNLDRIQLRKTLESQQLEKIYIARQLTPETAKKINKIGEPGISFDPEDLRVYPYNDEISHIVGFTGTEKDGLAGIEKKYNDILNNGNDIYLTLDSRVQYKIFNILTKGIEVYKYKGAVGIVIDVNTGELISGVSIPSFNPNGYHITEEPSRNQITASNFELGSVFKAITFASALNDNITNLDSKFDATAPLKIGKYFIEDFHPENRILSLEEVFIHSSNIGSARIALELGKERQSYYFEKLGLKNKIDSGILEVEYPKYPIEVRDIDVANMSFGYGISVSPLNIVSALAATVNGGEYIQPYVVIDSKFINRPRVKVFTEKVSNIMKILYRSNVETGTAKNIKPIPYLVGGKTGTANKNENNKYMKKKVISSLISFFPINNPRYALFVLVDEPKATGNIRGRTPGFNAVPLTKEIIMEIAPLLGQKSINKTEL